MALNDAQLHELSHPLRLRIFEMFANDPARSLSAADVKHDLEKKAEATVSQVAYHLARLQGVGLVPGPPTRNSGSHGIS
jgi:hypothetical protein